MMREAAAERLAAPLLRLASRVLRDVPPAEAPEAVAAVRAFAVAPSPAGYLAAARALALAERRRKLLLLGRAVGERRTEHGLEVLARSAGCSKELVEALRELPPDARNGRRLTLITELLTAHRLLAARATGAMRELRLALGPVPPRRPAPERRRERRPTSTRGATPRR